MAFFGLFGSDKPTEKNLQKAVTKVKERYAQPEFRRAAMDQLFGWGTPEAYDGLLARFTVVVQSPHYDEQEKRWLAEELASHGDAALQALRRFLAKENHIAYASKSLIKLCDDDQYATYLIEALQARTPQEYRSVQGKQELIHAMAETGHKDVVKAVLPYLEDHGDDVKCAAIDAVEKLGEDTDKLALLSMLSDDVHSARVLRYAAGAVSRLGLALDADKALEAAVIEDYVVKEGKLVSNRG
ncbi:MAG: HEAT repeat domain-containing protein [Deltaproteobacteria bacterium]|nr:HEAT repeat domain-containing protein [Deltaproteobacteria bacterium]